MSDFLITATEYHARVLNEAANQTRQICSFRQFCESWLKAESIQVLSAAEEHLIWQEVVKDIDFPDHEALVLSFEEADRLMHLYQIDMQALESFDAAMLQLFRAKRTAFEAYLDQVGKTTFLRALKALSLAKIPDMFQGANIELFGFVEFPPLYQAVFRQLQQGSTVIAPLESKDTEPVAAITYAARNPEEEFLVALRWIEQAWQKQPQQTFAIVVQQSVLPWSKIHRLLKVEPSPLKISCSKGEAFVDQPQFLFLEEVFKSLYHADLQLFSRVLVSPFWPDDFARRIKLDLWMREHLLRVSTLPEMLRALLYYDSDIQKTLWFQTWSKLANFEPYARDEFIRTYLSAAQFKDMPHIVPEHPNLHIVGTLEAAMLPVDVVWLLSADQEHYPVKKTVPILPKSILQQYDVPVESVALHQYGEKLVHAICDHHSVYASFVPVRRGEKNALSRLFRSVDTLSHSDIQTAMPKQNETKDLKTPQMQAGADAMFKIPLSRPQDNLLKSGTTLLKEQAECPFKAFAHFRLKVTGLKSGQEILDPLQKGSLIHHVLDKLWTKLQTQQQLKALTAQEQYRLICSTIDESLQESGPPSRRKLIQKLERNRLIRIIEAWLELEKQRPPFCVKATEVNTLVHLGGMQFKIRLDRIDQVGESEVIIDYKTGEVSAKNWFEERLRDLQLPLYAVTHAASGAVFASLKVGKMGFTGIVENEALSFDAVEILKEDKTWQMQRQHWQMQLEALMQEFQEGRLDVAPIDDKACLYCDLAGFCRIKEICNLT